MAKKNTSVNLEEDILDYIDKYREDNSLSSRNKALERIILKFQNQEKEIENLKYFESLVKNGNMNINMQKSNNDFKNENGNNNTPDAPISEKGKRFKSSLEDIE